MHAAHLLFQSEFGGFGPIENADLLCLPRIPNPQSNFLPINLRFPGILSIGEFHIMVMKFRTGIV